MQRFTKKHLLKYMNFKNRESFPAFKKMGEQYIFRCCSI